MSSSFSTDQTNYKEVQGIRIRSEATYEDSQAERRNAEFVPLSHQSSEYLNQSLGVLAIGLSLSLDG
jgi:hypothetical protein